MSHHQDSDGQHPASHQPSFSSSFVSVDSTSETLVDPDDPGFNSEFETDDDDQPDALSGYEDWDNPNGYSSDSSNSHSDYETRTDDADDEQCLKNFDDRLRTLTLRSQDELSKQPKSTQMILAREVSQVYNSYQQHGSAARLSVAIMSFLEGGEIVTRPSTRFVQEEEVDAFGNKTGIQKQVEKKVVERARLRFTPLPRISINPCVAESKTIMPVGHKLVSGKRKASDADVREGHKRHTGPFRNSESDSGDAMSMELPIISRQAPKSSMRDSTTGKAHMESVKELVDAQRLAYSRSCPQYQHLVSPPPFQPSISQRQGFPQHRQQVYQDDHNPHSQQLLSHQHPVCPPEHYSLTTDSETQSQILGRNPTIPFQPLADLRITIPQSPHGTTPPSTALPTLDRILSLHAHAGVQLHNALIDKYTLDPTPTRPHPPQPPAALFRLAITTALHSDLEHMFTPTRSHPLALSPKVRHLLRDLHSLRSGRLNPLEKAVVAKAAGVDEESVDAWWGRRNRERMPWNALREWILRREAEAVAAARREGTW